MAAEFSKFDINAFPAKSKDRNGLVHGARTAETSERYEDMCKFMRALVKGLGAGDDLTVEERNLLSVAYKNVVGARRASWRTLNATGEEDKTNELIPVYKQQLESELEDICRDVLELLESNLIKDSVASRDSDVFYLKMAGDYYRYLAEFISSKGYDQKAASNYEKAMKKAEATLSPTHPIRLGLALNYSVCFYEILKEHKKACDLAKHAFDEAISKLDQLDEASYKDSTLIMQLLRDNLTLWTSDNNEDDDNEAGDD